jgi:hypothetical protein
MTQIDPSTILDDALSTPTARGFVEDILETYGGAEVDYSRAKALGNEWHASGGTDVGDLWRELSRMGWAVQGALEPGCEDDADRRRLRVAIEEATAHALSAFGTARRTRRDRWLSYFTHEIRNSLNTLVNASWIIRNGEGRPAARICDMTDRAVHKLETLAKDLRELEKQVAKPAPGKPEKG